MQLVNKEATYQLIETKPQLSAALLLVITVNMFFYIYLPLAFAELFSIVVFFVLFKTTGFILDKESSKVKMISGYAGIKMGKWYRLPQMQYVSLLRIKQASNSGSGSAIVKNSRGSYGYQVNLIVQVHKEKRPFKLMTTNVKRAKEEGVKLGEFLNLKVLDSTTHNRQWIK